MAGNVFAPENSEKVYRFLVSKAKTQSATPALVLNTLFARLGLSSSSSNGSQVQSAAVEDEGGLSNKSPASWYFCRDPFSYQRMWLQVTIAFCDSNLYKKNEYMYKRIKWMYR